MKINKWLLFILCLVIAMGATMLSGCEKLEDDPEVTAQDYEMTLYFANGEYVASGDESLEKLLTYDTIISSTPENVHKDALEALKALPLPEGEYDTVVTEEIQIQSVTVEDSTAFVNLGQEGLNGGALTEIFLISQIVDTLVNNFEEIDQVQFLIEGEKAETLMGHFDAEVPFSGDLFGN